jgi:hypothetical protein
MAILCLFGSAALGQPWDGNGIEGDPYQIWTPNDMQAIGADSNYWDAHFVLCADIDLAAYTGTTYNIIGTSYTNPFRGVFDGNSHTISNFIYNSTGTDYVGLFGYVDDPNAEIKKLGLLDPNVDAGIGDDVGSLVGELSDGTISDCNSVGGSISGNDYIGGLVGGNTGTVSNSYATVSVLGNYVVGGLVGYNYSGTISSSYATGDVSGMGNSVGGLVGDNTGTVSNSYATASISGNSYVGGLVGYNSYGTISNSKSDSDVNGLNYVGGLVGYNNNNIFGTVINSYTVGDVNGVTNVGGLVGYSNSGSYTKCFWDSDVNLDVNGIGNGSDPNVIGETTANMQMESTFTDAGWDFVGEVINGPNDIWAICEGVNYPKLTWQFVIGDFDDDNKVNFPDFDIFAARWLDSDSSFYCGGGADLTNDGQVGLDDLRVFTDNYLTGF